MSNLVGNHIVGFPTRWLIFYKAILMCTHNQCLRAKTSNILKFFNFYNLGKICTIKILSNAWAFIQNNTFTIEGDRHLLEVTL